MHEIVRLIFDARAGQPISPARFAAALEDDLTVLERDAGVEKNTARLNPESEALQRHMRECLLVISALIHESFDPGSALFQFKNFPVGDFSYKTPQRLVSEGQTVDFLLRLQA